MAGRLMARLFGIEDALDSDAWYTPSWVFEGLGLMFDLDVAAPAEPLPWIPARMSYTVADDGLSLPWHGTVWCNPHTATRTHGVGVGRHTRRGACSFGPTFRQADQPAPSPLRAASTCRRSAFSS